jgi:hypothetical protein
LYERVGVYGFFKCIYPKIRFLSCSAQLFKFSLTFNQFSTFFLLVIVHSVLLTLTHTLTKNLYDSNQHSFYFFFFFVITGIWGLNGSFFTRWLLQYNVSIKPTKKAYTCLFEILFPLNRKQSLSRVANSFKNYIFVGAQSVQ